MLRIWRPQQTQPQAGDGRSLLHRYWLGIGAQMCGRRTNDARSRIGCGRVACSNRPDSSACCSAGAEDGATRSSVEHRYRVGWLRLGLATDTPLLEPVERRMGSAPLHVAVPLLWLVGSL